MSRTYIVNADAGSLDGWTPETLAAALAGPLGALGVAVECHPNESGLGGLQECEADILAEQVDAIVSRVVNG